MNLPPWACKVAFEAKLDTRYSIYSRINPFFLSGDFNGDGQLDVAIWVVNKRTRQRGMVILHQGEKQPFVIAAGGVALYDGGDDYAVFDMWTLIPKGEVLDTGYEEHRKVVLTGDAIEVIKSESSAHAIYWNGTKYEAYALSD
jgi:hypothetical protein